MVVLVILGKMVDLVASPLAPQFIARRGNFSLDFFPNEDGLVSSSPIFLAGDLARPLFIHVTSLISCALLSNVLPSTQFLTLLSPPSPSWDSSPGGGGCTPWSPFLNLSSSPNVKQLILLLLNSALLFSTIPSPHLCINTASEICLVRAVFENLTGRRWTHLRDGR